MGRATIIDFMLDRETTCDAVRRVRIAIGLPVGSHELLLIERDTGSEAYRRSDGVEVVPLALFVP